MVTWLVCGSHSCPFTRPVLSSSSSLSHCLSVSANRQTKEVFQRGKRVEAQQLGVSVALIRDDRRNAALRASHS